MWLQIVLCYSYIYMAQFYNIVFRIKHKLCVASGSTTPLSLPPKKNSGCVPGRLDSKGLNETASSRKCPLVNLF